MTDPKELFDIGEEQRPAQEKLNEFSENDSYGDKNLNPDGGSLIDKATRNSNEKLNRYNEFKQYNGPRR